MILWTQQLKVWYWEGNSLAAHVELAMAKVGLSGLHALKAFLQITDECLDNGDQNNHHHSVATVATTKGL